MTSNLVEPEARLAYLNRRLAGLLNHAALPLEVGAAQSLSDRLWVWGVVGGKDVGKTTLINALAGAVVAPMGTKVGEGTYQPAVYLSPDDEAEVRARFADRADVAMSYHAAAPRTMRHLSLVDLPDFDSLFTRHAAIVRRLAGVLDGIIWVVSPKKVADLAAIHRARDLLKDRGNFVYVVNKLDWLLAQSRNSAAAEIDRLYAALRAQIESADGRADAAHSFFVAARYGSADEITAAIAEARGGPAGSLNGDLLEAANGLVEQFEALRRLLTTPPDDVDAAARKQANLTYQTTALAHRLLEHHGPRVALAHARQLLDPARLGELMERFFSAHYIERVAARLHGERATVAEWVGELFEHRVSHWTGLGIVAWPILALGNLLQRRGRSDSGLPQEDALRLDGVDLVTRVHDLAASVRSRLADLPGAAHWAIPTSDELAAGAERAFHELREADRSAALGGELARRPGAIGRIIRRLLPAAILLWFPLIQPLSATLLTIATDGLKLHVSTLLAVTQALSGGKVLSGLGAALVVLMFVTAGIYTRARKDAARAWRRVEDRDPAALHALIRAEVLSPMLQPAEHMAIELEHLTGELEALAVARAA